MSRLTAWLLGFSRLTQSQVQVQASIGPGTLSNTATDYLRFVTRFFEAISQSAPHIYHSALLLAPHSSIVQKLYGQWIPSSLPKVVTGMPASWDSCITSTRGREMNPAVWSPCGQFIVTACWGAIEVWGSNTLESVSVLRSPDPLPDIRTKFLAFSPDGSLLACYYGR